jgi:hypothetical protein
LFRQLAARKEEEEELEELGKKKNRRKTYLKIAFWLDGLFDGFAKVALIIKTFHCHHCHHDLSFRGQSSEA